MKNKTIKIIFTVILLFSLISFSSAVIYQNTTPSGSISTSGTGGDMRGVKIHTLNDTSLNVNITVVKYTGSTATVVNLSWPNGTMIAQASYVGNNTTLANIYLNPNTDYLLTDHNNGAGWTEAFKAGGITWPIQNSHINVTYGYINDAGGPIDQWNDIAELYLTNVSSSGGVTITNGTINLISPIDYKVITNTTPVINFTVVVTPTTQYNLTNLTLNLYNQGGTLISTNPVVLSGNVTQSVTFNIDLPALTHPDILIANLTAWQINASSGIYSKIDSLSNYTFIIPNGWCYQQSPNSSNLTGVDNCGGLNYNGSINFAITWDGGYFYPHGFVNESAISDGLFTTGSNLKEEILNGTVFASGAVIYNYSFPSFAVDNAYYIGRTNGTTLNGLVSQSFISGYGNALTGGIFTGIALLVNDQIIGGSQVAFCYDIGTAANSQCIGSIVGGNIFYEVGMVWHPKQAENAAFIGPVPDINMSYNQKYALTFDGVHFFQNASSYIITVINPDNNQSINISASNPSLLTSKYLVQIMIGNNNVTTFQFTSYSQNYTGQIIPYACLSGNCINGTSFYLRISQSATLSTNFIDRGAGWLGGILPDASTLNLTQKLGYAGVIIFIINIAIILGAFFAGLLKEGIGKIVFALLTVINVITVIMLIALDYIPLALVIGIVIVILVIWGLKKKNG